MRLGLKRIALGAAAVLLLVISTPAPAAYFGEKAIQLLGGRRQTSLLFDHVQPIVRKLGEGESLHFSYGVRPSLWKKEDGARYFFRVIIEHGWFSKKVIHDEVIDPFKRGAHRGWQNIDIDLSPWAGSKVKITFESGHEGAKAPEKVEGIVWGGLEIGDYRRKADRPNIVLISIDTLSSQHLGLYGYQRPTTPFMDAIATKAVWFRNMIGQSSWTKPSHMSIMTGLWASAHHIWSAPHRDTDLRELSEDIPTLAEYLSKNGYSTQAFTGGGYVSARFGFARGFSRYEEFQGSDHKDASFVFSNAKKYLAANKDRRYFLFIHTFDGPHKPYRREFFVRQQEAAGKKAVQRDWYDGGVRAADILVNDVFQDLATQGVLENTVFIITADHGQEVEDRGYHFADHGHTLYDDLVRVPLIIRYDGHIKPREVDGFQAQHIDIVPTVLDLAGVDHASATLQGESLKAILLGDEPAADTRVFSEWTEFGTFDLFALRTMGPDYAYKLIYCPSVVNKTYPENKSPGRGDKYWYRKLIPEGGVEFYDLKKDPGEKNNLAKSNPPAMKSMLPALLDHIRGIASASATDTESLIKSSPELDKDLREQLRSLGY